MIRLLFFCILLNSIYGKRLSTFYISLNEEASDQEQWAEATADMPPLTELTLCHWEKIAYFNLNTANVWSYCVKMSDEFGGITCVQYFAEINNKDHNGGKSYSFFLEFQNSSRQEFIRMKDYEEKKMEPCLLEG